MDDEEIDGGEWTSNSSNSSALMTDLYQIVMAAAFYSSSYHREKETIAIFEMFVRKLPKNRSYMVVAGLEQAIQYMLNLHYNDKQIAYLQSLEIFKNVDQEFFAYLRQFKFRGSIWAAPEGTILFPNEPIMRIEGPIIEAQLLETYILSMLNFQSLIATKASIIVQAAKGRPVVEFGSRRAHGPQAGVLAARGAFIGGCVGTSNTLAGMNFGIPVFGTMAHSFIMSYEKEIDALRDFHKMFPSGFLLVDTYDTIKAVRELLRLEIRPNGIRLDSGDLYGLSMETRNLLDNAGFKSTKIMTSGDLNEYSISRLIEDGAPIDYFGVGTELSTSRDDPAMNGVYKLVAIKIQDHDRNNSNYKMLYKLKTSIGKETYPGPKQICRFIENKEFKKDYLIIENEEEPPDNSIPLLKKYIDKGNKIFKMPSIFDIQNYFFEQMKFLPPVLKSLEVEPIIYPVAFSQKIKSISHQSNPS